MTKADAREVARTVALLTRKAGDDLNMRDPVEDALALHRIAGSLHRYDERSCSEDLTCRACGGEGSVWPSDQAVERGAKEAIPCKPCAGSGLTIGKRVANLERKARELASAYGFRAYFQGDCRGCPLYLIPEESIPVTVGLDEYAYGKPTDHATLQARWIESNYSSRGVPVVWLG